MSNICSMNIKYSVLNRYKNKKKKLNNNIKFNRFIFQIKIFPNIESP